MVAGAGGAAGRGGGSCPIGGEFYLGVTEMLWDQVGWSLHNTVNVPNATRSSALQTWPLRSWLVLSEVKDQQPADHTAREGWKGSPGLGARMGCRSLSPLQPSLRGSPVPSWGPLPREKRGRFPRRPYENVQGRTSIGLA